MESPNVALIEIGPHAALAGPVRDVLKEIADLSRTCSAKYMSAMKRQDEPREHLLSMASSLLCRGFQLHPAQIASFDTSPTLLTDLPNYPFNHTKSYWHRSRLTEAYEHGGSPWNVVLGHRSPSGGGSIEFRNVFTLDDIPWLRDHQVNGLVVFPMAGYVSMVVEALALTQKSETPIDRFRLRELSVGKALRLVESVQHEMFTVLRQHVPETRQTGPGGWHSFEVWSWTEAGGFCEHCKGFASVHNEESDPVGSVGSRKAIAMRDLCSDIESRTHREIAAGALYRQASQAGLEYGPAFSLLKSLNTGYDVAVGNIEATDTASLMLEKYETRLVIHPTLLDACLHVGLCNLGGKLGKLAGLRAHVPTFIEDITIAADMFASENPKVLRSYCHNIRPDSAAHSTTTDMTCFADATELPVIEMRNIRMVGVS